MCVDAGILYTFKNVYAVRHAKSYPLLLHQTNKQTKAKQSVISQLSVEIRL